MPNGKYIVIDGVAPSKSEMIEMLAHQLKAIDIPVRIMDEQSLQEDTSTRAIHYLLKDPAYPLNPRTEVLLYNALRSQLVEISREIRNKGNVCLSTQSYLSTLVTEYYGRGDITDYPAATAMIQFATATVEPDLLIILDSTNPSDPNRQGQAEQALFERLRAGYLWEARQRNLPVVYATEDLDATFQQIWAHVARTLSVKNTVPVPTSTVRSAAKQSKSAPVNAPPIVLPSTAKIDKPRPEREKLEPAPAPISYKSVSVLASESMQGGMAIGDWERTFVNTPFEQKDAEDHYRYYIPESLKGKLRSQYIRAMNQHFGQYSQMFTALSEYLRKTAGTPVPKRDAAWEERLAAKTRQVLAPILPLATTVEVPASFAVKELNHSNTVKGPSQVANQYLPPGYTTQVEPVMLTDYSPRNELDTAADILYSSTDLPLRALRDEVAKWPYTRKADLVSTTPDKSASRYTFELLTDYIASRALQIQTTAQVAHQSLTPRYGYDTPSFIEDAGLSDTYDEFFDRSLSLYSALQAEQPDLAPYAILMGHQLRWRFTCTLQDLAVLNRPHKLLEDLRGKVGEVHPLLHEALFAPASATASISQKTNIAR